MSELGLFFLSVFKFFLAPPAGIALGFSFQKTLALTISGGVFGVTFFYYFGRLLNRSINRLIQNTKLKNKRKATKKFTFTNKLIVRLKMKMGVTGLAIASPVLISIPLGSILASKYFHKNTTLFYFSVWVVVWSLALTGLSTFFRDYLYYP